MAPLQVEAEVKKSLLKLIYVPQKSPINPNIKLMKSLGVEGRSVGVCADIWVYVFVGVVCVGVFGRGGAYHDKEATDQGESNDDKCHSTWEKSKAVLI